MRKTKKMSQNNPKSKVLLLSKYFIFKNKEEKLGLSNKKLQKLLYYAQAWSLVLNKKPIFDDKIEAWVHGPAIPSVYFTFKDFGFKDVDIKFDTKELGLISKEDKKILDEVWRIYGKFDAPYLEALSHNETPWQEARKGLLPHEISDNEISTESMKQYYGQKIQKTN